MLDRVRDENRLFTEGRLDSGPGISPDISPDISVDSSADRVLRARLAYSFVKRGGAVMPVPKRLAGRLGWFEYRFRGFRTGIAEGVLLGTEDGDDCDWLTAVTSGTRAHLVKLTRMLPDAGGEPISSCERRRGWTIVRSSRPTHEILSLAATDSETLALLGRHTRRNVRAARKHAEKAGLTFTASRSDPLLTAAARLDLSTKTRPNSLREGEVARLEVHAAAADRPFRSVVRDADGRAISYCCGYFGASSAAYLMYQLNDSADHAIGPALLHRALLIPWLIEQGCTELVFVHGCIGVLAHSCQPQQIEEIWLMRRSARAYAFATLIRWFKPDAPIGKLAALGLGRAGR